MRLFYRIPRRPLRSGMPEREEQHERGEGSRRHEWTTGRPGGSMCTHAKDLSSETGATSVYRTFA
jgi:hypothetical protein